MIICITSVGGFELPEASVDILAECGTQVLAIPLRCKACLVLVKSISTCLHLCSEESV